MSAVDVQPEENDQLEGEVDGDRGTSTRSVTARLLTASIHGYQAVRSGRPTGCRFVPSCSEYAVEAVDAHGSGHGLLLAARRIARCGPWGGHGIDPVPERSNP